jgi:uncharacterized protein (TIGR02302 family)
MRRQQQMMNETFGLGQQQQGEQQLGEMGEKGSEGQQGEGEQGQGQQGMTPQEFAEAMRRLQQGQGKLREDLEGLTQGLEGLGIQPGKGFGEAGEAMGEAEGALGEGDADNAVGAQGRALEALRKGAQGLAQAMQDQGMGMGPGPGQPGRTGRQRADQGTDPLGRPLRGRDYGDDVTVKVPGEIDVQRARRILEELRRRFGDAGRPQIELDYIERLLKDF